MSVVIKIENVSKKYQIGLIGTNTLKGDIHRWWYNLRGLPDPTLMIGQENSLRTTNSKNDISDEYVWALRDINYEVQQGEVLGIIGKNGAGKSTLLKLLSRVTAPTTGSIKVKGRIASLLEVGTGFHPELTGRENIFLNGAILGMTKAEIQRKLDEIVDFAGIEKYINTPVKRYSSGMYVRLAFAVAAHLEPEILIVDEVLAVGDAEFQKKALGKMHDISTEQGRTVLFVSHNMAAVQNLCKKGLVMKNGLIVFEGKCEDAINNYLSKEVSLNQTLIERSDRTGNGLLKIYKIEIRDKNENINRQILAGDSLQITLYYEKFTNDIIEAIPSVLISSTLNEPIFLHHSRLNGMIFNLTSKFGSFNMIVDKLPLIPSIYNITFSISGNGECYDSISNATDFNVIESNYYGKGEIPPRTHGFLIADTKWEINTK